MSKMFINKLNNILSIKYKKFENILAIELVKRRETKQLNEEKSYIKFNNNREDINLKIIL